MADAVMMPDRTDPVAMMQGRFGGRGAQNGPEHGQAQDGGDQLFH
jgi:hypothetical protein